jgi:sugar lactone lactonase YvrE
MQTLFLRFAVALMAAVMLALGKTRADILYVSNSGDGTVSQVASNGTVSPFASGFTSPQGLVFDSSGNLYVANLSNTVSKVPPTGGTGSTYFTGGSNQKFVGLALDSSGNLYLADSQTGQVVKVAPPGVTGTVFSRGYNMPSGLALDGSANLFVADQQTDKITKVPPTGGNGTVFVNNMGLNAPIGMAFDGSGNLYVANSATNSVLEVTPGGAVSTFATGFSTPEGLAFDSSGNLYVVNNGNNTVSMVTPGGAVSTFASGFNVPTFIAIRPQATPEPSSLALLGMAAGAMAGYGWWSRRRSQGTPAGAPDVTAATVMTPEKIAAELDDQFETIVAHGSGV